MIRLHRGDEPPELAQERSRRVARLWLDWLDGHYTPEGPTPAQSGLFDSGYGGARTLLHERMGRKCAYCERNRPSTDPIDHHRPRRAAWQGQKEQRALVHPGYGWLAWSFDNQLTACTECNNRKSNDFPIGGTRMPLWSVDTSNEGAEILDPARVDPTRHIEFTWSRLRRRWVAQGITPLGQTTVRHLHLDEPSDRYDNHLTLLDDLRADLDAARRHGEEALRACWRRKINVFVNRLEAGYRLLTRDWMRQELADLIQAFNLEVPTLADDTPAPPPLPLLPPEPRLAHLDRSQPTHLRLELTIRALNPERNTREAKEAVLLAFAQAGGGSIDVLAAMVPQISDLVECAAALAQAGRLGCVGGMVRRP